MDDHSQKAGIVSKRLAFAAKKLNLEQRLPERSMLLAGQQLPKREM
ncbi:hypothetical protein [Allocoleopsis franciscana]|uniref:Uncharacterized protein n=1 Tax=Allocoleopsis franciscana PCC 7113 TaxID=1173027 RepID=K9WFS0_9CYAN|nr:hypothetical protein [Allocoleopsis franciscana]AFZ18631.1 hypothetical protein Mic7113_2850 [Allocoleopsis franciscana PCC 7113]